MDNGSLCKMCYGAQSIFQMADTSLVGEKWRQETYGEHPSAGSPGLCSTVSALAQLLGSHGQQLR